MRIVPGWGGSMFEELMPDVFVPEASWAPRSWGLNHPLHVRAQREHGLVEAGYGYWGFSPSSDPVGGYREYGVDALGLNPEGYFSDQEKTNYDVGFGDCRAGTNPHPDVTATASSPRTRRSSPCATSRPQAYANLVELQHELKAYGERRVLRRDRVASGTVARRYLSLDQAMIMGAVGKCAGRRRDSPGFQHPCVERQLRPVIGMERFGAGIV